MADSMDNSLAPSLNNSMEDANMILEQPIDQSGMNPMVGTNSMESNAEFPPEQQQQQLPLQNDDSLILENLQSNDTGDSMNDMPTVNNNQLTNNDSMDEAGSAGVALDHGNNDSMDMIAVAGNRDNMNDSPTDRPNTSGGDMMSGGGGEPPPVELLADDAAQSRYQAKIAEDGYKQMKRTALPLALSFQKFALRIGQLRDSGDALTQRLIQLAELCSYNTSVRSGMANCTRWLACLLDHANVRAYRIQDNIAVPLINKFTEHFRQMKTELKATRSALSREDSQYKRLTQQHRNQLRNRQSRAASVEYQKTYSKYENARRDRRETAARLDQLLQRLRTNRMSDVRQALRNFCHTELHYHCKAIETLTEAYQQVKSMDVEKDQQEFRRALNIAGMMNKTYEYNDARPQQQQQQQQRDSRSPVRASRSGVRARLRQAGSRYMMRNRQPADRPQRSAPRPQYDINVPPGLMVPNYPRNNDQITARKVARELHRVDTMIDQNQIRQAQQRYEPKPQKLAVPPIQRQDYYNETTTSTQQQQRRNIYQPPPPLPPLAPFDVNQALLRPPRAPTTRATSAPPPGGMRSAPNYGAGGNSGRQKPYEDDAMFDYLNQRLTAERKRYDRELEARNRFETEQFSSMKRLPPYRESANAAEQQQQQTYAAANAMLANDPLSFMPQQQQQNFSNKFEFNEPPPPPPLQMRRQQQTTTTRVRQQRQQQQQGNTSGGRRAPATRETKTSFHVTDYDHGPLTIFPPQMQPEIDYSRTHDTTSFHSNEIQNPVRMPYNTTTTTVMQQQQRVVDGGGMNNNRQRRFSGGNDATSLGGGASSRGPIVYRNPEPDHLPPQHQQQQQRSNRPASAGNPNSSRQQQSQPIYRPMGYNNPMNDEFLDFNNYG